MFSQIDTLGLSATITAQGISAPDYQSLLTTLQRYFRQLYGTDAYLEPDSKDGQMIALVALAIHDTNNSAIGVYNAFSPATAQSDALTRNVRLNGIIRKTAIPSQVDLTLYGTPGTVINNGIVSDLNGVRWLLPETAVIAPSGETLVTAICAQPGEVAALPATITHITTPTQGWLRVTNLTAAAVGSSAESDEQLRQRQSVSVGLSGIAPFAALNGAIANLSGVTRHKLYENDHVQPDANGIPGHSVAAIVEGGDARALAETLYMKKGQGVGTWGTTTLSIADSYGNPHSVSFSRPVPVPVYCTLTLKVFHGYTSQIGSEICQLLADYINSLGIGNAVLLSRLYSPANIGVVSGGNSRYYDITALQIGTSPDQLKSENITIAYDAMATCQTENIVIKVLE